MARMRVNNPRRATGSLFNRPRISMTKDEIDLWSKWSVDAKKMEVKPELHIRKAKLEIHSFLTQWTAFRFCQMKLFSIHSNIDCIPSRSSRLWIAE